MSNDVILYLASFSKKNIDIFCSWPVFATCDDDLIFVMAYIHTPIYSNMFKCNDHLIFHPIFSKFHFVNSKWPNVHTYLKISIGVILWGYICFILVKIYTCLNQLVHFDCILSYKYFKITLTLQFSIHKC